MRQRTDWMILLWSCLNGAPGPRQCPATTSTREPVDSTRAFFAVASSRRVERFRTRNIGAMVCGCSYSPCGARTLHSTDRYRCSSSCRCICIYPYRHLGLVLPGKDDPTRGARLEHTRTLTLVEGPERAATHGHQFRFRDAFCSAPS